MPQKSKPTPLSVLAYEQARELAFSPDERNRRYVAGHPDVHAEILYYLCNDDVVDIRVAVASNPSTPHKANKRLAQDSAEAVRLAVAEKITNQACEQEAQGARKLSQSLCEVLEILIGDSLRSVRLLVAQRLAGLKLIPRAIRKALARDPDPEIAGYYAAPIMDAEFTEIVPAKATQQASTLCPRARQHYQQGTLTVTLVEEAVRLRDRDFLISALALLANVPLRQVRKAFRLQSAKGIVCLCWAAGLSPGLAYQLQTRIAGVTAGNAYPPKGQSYALSESAMVWHLELMADLLMGD